MCFYFSVDGRPCNAPKNLILALLALAFAVLVPFSVLAATVPGAIPGSFGVSEAGAATFSVPIAVPPGTAGMEPKLLLNYSSQGGNGLLGVGWTLSGLSAITRCTANPAPDSSVRVSYTAVDRFCLDGQRLVSMAGIYGSAGAEYRTEQDTFVKVVSSGTAGSGPSSFKVWTKAGFVMEYGNTSDSRVLAEGKPEVRVWALNRISDTAGNFYTVSYIQNGASSEYAPTRIDYTGNGAVVPYNHVEFIYEARPDSTMGFVAGSLVGLTQRLAHVISYSGNTLVSDYTLTYDTGPVTQRSRLISIGRCAGNGDCMAPTVLTWSAGEIFYDGVIEATTPTGSVNDLTYALGDINADGRTDALVFDTRNNTFSPLLAQADGTLAAGATTVASMGEMLPDKRLWLADMDGNGTADAVMFGRTLSGGTVDMYGESHWSSSSAGTLASSQSPEPESHPRLISESAELCVALPAYRSQATNRSYGISDQNADGRPEVMAFLPNRGLYTTTIANPPRNQIAGSIAGVNMGDTTSLSESWFYEGDVNGDGLGDALRYDPYTGQLRIWLTIQDDIDGSPRLAAVPLSQTIAMGGSPADRWFLQADINGDGLSDLVLHTPATNQLQTWIAAGDGTFAAGPVSNLANIFTSGGRPSNTWFQMVDINADGRADAVKYNPSTGWLTYAPSLGDGQFGSPTSVYLGGGPQPTPDVGPSPATQWFSSADINGDGVLDWVRYDPAWGHIKISLGQGGVPDQLLAVTNGLGSDTSFNYKPLTDAMVYTKGTGAAYPEQDIQTSMQVVSEVATDDGISGSARRTWHYDGLKANLAGGGLRGFKTITVRDEQTGISTVTEYRQDAPFTGHVARVTQSTAGGATLRQTDYTYAQNATAYNAFVYQKTSSESTYELNGVLVTRFTTDQTLDGYGNVTFLKTEAFAGASTTSEHSQTTTNTYINDTANWLLGRLTRSAVTQAANSLTQTRVSAFVYHPITGLLTQETIEPDQPQFQLDTVYDYDAYGNRRSATVRSPATGTAAIVARTTSTIYDAKGQFPVTAANALGHTESKIHDPRFGTVTSLTGPNGLTTTWQYDGFGRKIQENRADGTQTVWTYDVCDAACPAHGVYRVVTQVFSAGVQSAPASVAYFDSLNRELRTATQGFDGSWIYKDTVYDTQGRVEKVSRPYFAGQPSYWVTSEYDDLGRLVKVFEPDDIVKPALVVDYNGLTVSRTNRKGQTTSETKNSWGQKISVTDAMGKLTIYAHDPFGNLTQTTDPSGNQIINIYDIRGRKIQTTDPDLGLWKYEYNVLGELTKQTDAKNQTSTFTYDKLGRMTQRVEPGLTSDWIYDTAAYGKGKLQQARTSAGYARTHYYDNKGRPQLTGSSMDGNLLSSNVYYDTSGRVSRQTYPNGLGVKNVYNAYGYLSEVRNASSNALYWRVDQMDAEGHITKETYGNGVVTDHSYYTETGHLQNIVAEAADGQQIQGQAYQYDEIGNVYIYADGPGNQLEIRGGYDRLNRLTQIDSTINGVASSQILGYDGLGNITSKTGVGNYYYGSNPNCIAGGAGPHAVCRAGSNAYAYDANGNLAGGAGRSLTWTAWNMPESLTQSGQIQSWLYGPEHERYKLTTSGRTTWYLNPSVHQGGHYERTEYASGTIEHRITLYGGGRAVGEILTFEVASGTAPAAQTRYFHSDQQGSITAVTDSTGTVITRYRYDPWGRQTLILGSNTGIDQTRQGHTGHEMLDGGLTHMNGRLYDPVLARFVSADPTVDNPFDLQSLNRYSYVNNNPLGFTDPSGYFKIFGKKWSWIRDKVVKPVVAAWVGYYTFGFVQWGVGAGLGGGVGGYAAGTIAGAAAAGVTTSVITTGSTQGWQQNALSALLFNGVGDLGTSYNIAENSIGRAGLHALAGCISASSGGGNCGQGALSAGFAQYAGSNLGSYDSFVTRVVLGGTASVIGGGKFENGASTAAFGYLFNDCTHNTNCLNFSSYRPGDVDMPDGNGKWMWVPVGDSVCGAAVGGNLCGTQSQQINKGISTAVKVVQFLFPETLAGRAINYIDSAITYVGAVFSGSPKSAVGTVAGTVVTNKLKPYMTNNANAERIGIATELTVDKAVNGK